MFGFSSQFCIFFKRFKFRLKNVELSFEPCKIIIEVGIKIFPNFSVTSVEK